MCVYVLHTHCVCMCVCYNLFGFISVLENVLKRVLPDRKFGEKNGTIQKELSQNNFKIQPML
jgi:hypothetical protein